MGSVKAVHADPGRGSIYRSTTGSVIQFNSEEDTDTSSDLVTAVTEKKLDVALVV